MKTDRIAFLALALLGGCASHPNPAATPMRPPGIARPPLVAAVPPPFPAPSTTHLPERIEFPATYRLLQLDGHLALVRDADAVPIGGTPTALRVVAGELARGELAYQPALLPQELAAQVAASREGAVRLEHELAEVMARSRTLSEQALELKAQSQKLAELLAAAETRLHAADTPKAAPPAAEAAPE